MVEIAYLARRSKTAYAEVIERLIEAGVDSLPGGGAEIFSERVRRIICDHKIDGEEWLEVARTAHRLGLKSNCTMLYGHIENEEDRVDHLLKLRALQDETGGFQTFIPLAFHPDNTPLAAHSRDHRLRRPQEHRRGAPDARQHPAHQGLLGDDDAADRPDRAALRRGRHRRHRGGGEDLPRRRRDHGQSLRRGELLRLIREAGRDPVERDTLYRPVARTDTTFTVMV